MKIKIGRARDADIVAIDTGCNDVEITEAFVGPMFGTSAGETLAVCMRDNGFDLMYVHQGVHTTIVCNNGDVTIS